MIVAIITRNMNLENEKRISNKEEKWYEERGEDQGSPTQGPL